MSADQVLAGRRPSTGRDFRGAPTALGEEWHKKPDSNEHPFHSPSSDDSAAHMMCEAHIARRMSTHMSTHMSTPSGVNELGENGGRGGVLQKVRQC